jgi:putative ABC transport system permease protein
MLMNYIKTAFRNMRQHRVFAIINLIGLTLGLGSSLALLTYVADDWNWDGFHKNKGRIYLLTQLKTFEGADMEPTSMIAPPLAPALSEEIPEVEAATRFGARDRLIIRKEGEKYDEGLCCFADPEFFRIFSFPMDFGDRETALDRPDAILLHRKVAQRHFGDENPVGKTLVWGEDKTSIITGVYDIPEVGSHLQFNALCPTEAVIADGRPLHNWREGYVTGYVLLKQGSDPQTIAQKIPGVLDKHLEQANRTMFGLQPLQSLHLRSNHIRTTWNFGKGNILYTVSLASIALFLLLIACINYTNLATAQCVPRSKEVGMRRVIGATKKDLRIQFFSESILMVFMASILAVVVVELAQPWLSNLAGRPVSLNLMEYRTLAGILGLTFGVGLLSGLYPAFVLSAFQPADVFKRALSGLRKGRWFRRGLVVFQFVLSVFLIIGVGIIQRQIQFMQNKDLGFSHDQVMYVQISGLPAAMEHRQALKDRFGEVPGVEAVGLSGSLPGLTYARASIVPEGYNGDWAMDMVIVDDACRDVYEFRVLEGRFLSEAYPTDNLWDESQTGALVLNETAVQRLGWKNPIGKTIALENWGVRGTVVGVVKDFHNQSLHERIEPIILADLGWDAFLNLRLSTQGVTGTIAQLRSIWAEFVPDEPLPFRFISEEYERFYQSERRIGILTGIFSVLAIIIAALGIFGLTLFSTERRTKEVGIRKVLGASANNIVLLFSKEFLACVFLANLISWPVAYVFMEKWLQNFAYKTALGFWPFVLASATSCIIAMVTVSYQSIKTAATNPAQSLRYE